MGIPVIISYLVAAVSLGFQRRTVARWLLWISCLYPTAQYLYIFVIAPAPIMSTVTIAIGLGQTALLYGSARTVGVARVLMGLGALLLTITFGVAIVIAVMGVP